MSVFICFTAELPATIVTFPLPERDYEGVHRNVHLAALCILSIQLFFLHLSFPKFWLWKAI